MSASLAALPPPPLPPELAARISAAIAAEAEAAPAPPVPAPAPSVASATVTPLPGRRPSSRRTWPLSVAAGVVLVCAVGLGYAQLAGSKNAGQVTAADSAAGVAAPEAVLPRSASGIDYADPAAVTAGLPSVLVGSAPREPLGATSGSDRAAPPAEPLASSSGASGPEAALAADPLARLRDPAGLASCLLALLPPEEPDVRPLALDYARYGATPALAVVLPDPDPAKVSVFVVGPDCSKDNDSTLLFTRLTKP
ncbi:MAG: hypothetical protein KY451_08075 [Actinobacteria bacterium]|nr:hypothetical protein [Actinomycetota bacterium]MBW3647370.1 hypothetical protein [Actinomycetota bacterium]